MKVTLHDIPSTSGAPTDTETAVALFKKMRDSLNEGTSPPASTAPTSSEIERALAAGPKDAPPFRDGEPRATGVLVSATGRPQRLSGTQVLLARMRRGGVLFPGEAESQVARLRGAALMVARMRSGQTMAADFRGAQ